MYSFFKTVVTRLREPASAVAHWDYSTQGKERAVIQNIGTSKLKT
jgi:hypothetical protein